MIKKILILFLFSGFIIDSYSQNAESVNVDLSELRDEAISSTFEAIEAYNQFYATQNKTNLIQGIKAASRANTLFEIYIEVKNIPEDADLVSMTNGIARYYNEYAEDLINVPYNTFEVSGDQVSANSDDVAHVIMHSITNSKILERWFEGWEERNYEN